MFEGEQMPSVIVEKIEVESGQAKGDQPTSVSADEDDE